MGSAMETSQDFPPPKTDKPRPHVCTTCTRGFARLEHLKRHERSHTKEKPFACEQCTRCFARRDLLLRHQQKLHMTAPPSSRGKGGRRESTNSVSGGTSTGRVRKNSIATSGGSGPGSMRPRANTISHVDKSATGMLPSSANLDSSHEIAEFGFDPPAATGLPGVAGYQFRGMSTAQGRHGNSHQPPRLETRNRNVDIGASLRTAPPIANPGGPDANKFWTQPGSTVNPAQLHFANSPQTYSYDSPTSPFGSGFTGFLPSHATMDGDGSFPWLASFENQMTFCEQAVDNSSPSDSEGSLDATSDLMLDPSVNCLGPTEFWPSAAMTQPGTRPRYTSEISGPRYAEPYNAGQVSPKSVGVPFGEQYFPAPPIIPSQPPTSSMYPGVSSQHFFAGHCPKSETPSNSAASTGSSNRQSSVTSMSTDSITDVTRNALLTSLSQQSLYGYNHLKTSQPQVSSPLSHISSARSGVIANVPLPSTYDLQRYVGAYIQYFHPHLPFLHAASLSFDSPAFTSVLQVSSNHYEHGQSEIVGGGGALILAMAAIGALYEYDFEPSRDLFDMSRTMIRLYTGERHKVDMSSNKSHISHATNNFADTSTPLWLVQAMLLNVIYGHNCGDKVAAGIASNLCGSVINLARSARLVDPMYGLGGEELQRDGNHDVDMIGGDGGANSWPIIPCFGANDIHSQWMQWKAREERKRTLFAVFILSSLLTSAYNHAPALTNSEIRLELPCDECLWAAESAEIWASMGGSEHQHEILFANALTSLLTAHQRQQQDFPVLTSTLTGALPELENLPPVDFKPSTFGCLVLINALHNYIWETRQRHPSIEWSSQETEAMHSHIEPALRTWQAAWSLNPEHSTERPNPFGATSLSADCIPLLDLAYLRLFVNLGKSKEAFFQRDWDGMAKELASGKEIIQHADDSTYEHDATSEDSPMKGNFVGSSGETDAIHPNENTGGLPRASKRERHLRKAAFYAANSLTLADKLGVTFADFSSRELPLQSALCAFDCAQVLAEWSSALQQRLGRGFGIIGKQGVELSADLAILLEKEDVELIGKIKAIIENIRLKLGSEIINNAVGGPANLSVEESGLGTQILLVHAQMFERASIWPRELFTTLIGVERLTVLPVTKEIAQSLRIQAMHIHERSLAPSPAFT